MRRFVTPVRQSAQFRPPQLALGGGLKKPLRVITMKNTIPTVFHGQPLEIINHNGQRWLTAEQVGLALGYSNANAGQGVRNLHNRHADEFTELDTCQINLSWQGQMRQMRVFSATGCQLLGFFSNTPRAKQFRRWAKQVLANQSAAAVTPEPVVQSEAYEIPAYVRKELLASRPLWAKIQRYYQLGLNQAEIATLVNRAPSTLRKHLNRMSRCQLIDYQPDKHFQELGRLGRQAQMNLLDALEEK